MINVNSNCQSQTAMPLKMNKGHLIDKQLNFDIQLAQLNGQHRNEIETFIKQGFAKTYNA